MSDIDATFMKIDKPRPPPLMLPILMAHVFISYSRKDDDFVRRLSAALTERGKEVWVDWEDIHPSAKWKAEIAASIVSAEAFVFVVSPDSIASQVCAWELDQAQQNNKRLIPVVWREPTGSISQTLRDINWIFFQQPEQFTRSLEALISAVDTDLDWLQMHTRMLVRGHEWERGGSDTSFLLRGLDLEQALKWRLSEPGKVPAPTLLHSRYILASQEAQAEEKRRWQAMYENAERQRRRALSRQFAMQSIASTEKRLDLAILLALLAFRQDDTVEARSALLNAITISPFLTSVLRGAHERVSAAVLSGDGKLIAHTTPAKELMVWSVETRRCLFTLTLRETPLALAFTPDSMRLAVGTESGSIELYSMHSPAQAGTQIAKEDTAIGALVFAPDGERVAVGTRSGTVTIWNLESKERNALSPRHTDAVTGLSFSDSGDRLASASKDRQVWLWNLAGPGAAPVALTQSNVTVRTDTPLRVAFDRRENRFVSAALRAILLGSDAATEQERELRAYPELIASVAISPNGETLVFGDDKGHIGLWDLTTGQQFGRTLDLHTACVNDVAFHPDGRQIMSASNDGAVALWNISPPNPYVFSLTGHYDLVYSIAFSPDGKRLVSASKTSILVWDVATRKQIGEPILKLANSTVTVAAIGPAGTVLAATHTSCALALYDLGSHDFLTMLGMTTRDGQADVVHHETVTGIGFTSDEKLLVSIAQDGTLAVWMQSESGEFDVRVIAGLPELYTLAIHPTEHIAAVAGKGGSVYLFDLQTLERIGEPLAMEVTVYRVTFSPDGNLLAAGTGAGTLQLWEWREQRPFGETIVAHADRIYAAEFHPDGKMLATGGADGAILLWDVQTQQPYAKRLHAHTGCVYGIAFNSDGWMASCSDDLTVNLWDMNVESWQARAKDMANRNLTPREWRRYMTNEPYAKLFEDLP
jgi:WD40 repeat protein